MSILAWVMLGLVAGFVGGKLMASQERQLLASIGLGVAGAVAAGLLLQGFSGRGVGIAAGLIVPMIGASAFVAAYHAFTGRRGAA